MIITPRSTSCVPLRKSFGPFKGRVSHADVG